MKNEKLEKYYLNLLNEKGLNSPKNFTKKQKDLHEGLSLNNGLEYKGDKFGNLYFKDFQELIKKHSENIHSSVYHHLEILKIALNENEKYILDNLVHAKTFPTGSINAQVGIYPEGYLILVNYGLTSFLSSFYSLIYRDKKLQNKLFNHEVGNTIEHEDVKKELSKLFFLYFDNDFNNIEKSFVKYLIGRNDGLLFFYDHNTLNETFSFILAHELAHIYSGHLDEKHTTTKYTPAGSIRFASKSWQQEFEADLFASKIIGTKIIRLYQDKEFLGHYQNIAVTAIVMFFLIDMTLSGIQKRIIEISGREPILISDHPDGILRIKNLVENNFKRFSQGESMIDKFINYFLEIKDELFEITAIEYLKKKENNA